MPSKFIKKKKSQKSFKMSRWYKKLIQGQKTFAKFFKTLYLISCSDSIMLSR